MHFKELNGKRYSRRIEEDIYRKFDKIEKRIAGHFVANALSKKKKRRQTRVKLKYRFWN